MNKIFLGKAWHWLVLIASAGLLWFSGSQRLHVIEFNLFVIAMLCGTTVAIFAVICFHRPGDRVTRDALVAHEDEGSNAALSERG